MPKPVGQITVNIDDTCKIADILAVKRKSNIRSYIMCQISLARMLSSAIS